MNDALNLYAIATGLATHLPGYVVEPKGEDHAWYVRLKRASDGAELSISKNSKPGMLHVSGRYPSDGTRGMAPRDWGAVAYNETGPDINVTASRSPDAIAKDIARRFLSEYERIYAACLVKQEERNASRSDQRNAVQQVAKALGFGARGPKADDVDNVKVSYHGTPDGYGDLTPTSINLRSLSLACVLDIAAVVAKHNNQKSVEG